MAMTVTTTWWTEYSNRNTNESPHGAVTSFLSFTDRDIVGIAPITEVGVYNLLLTLKYDGIPC